jgi:hypothetical protein
MGWNPEKRPRERGFTKSGHDKLQRADVTVWTTIGVIALVDAGFALQGPIELDFRSFLIPTAATAPLAAATSGFPLRDATLEACDRQLGIDWTQLLTFVPSRPGLQYVLSFGHSSLAACCLPPRSGVSAAYDGSRSV